MDAALRLKDPIAPQLVANLRQGIADMTLPPGTALSEKDIAARFGVSRQPVRESGAPQLASGRAKHISAAGQPPTAFWASRAI